jgi:hypothetical protein
MSDGQYFVPKALAGKFLTMQNSLLEHNIKMLKHSKRTELIENYYQYKKLNSRHWFKKRKLEKSIIADLAFWIEDIKAIHIKESIPMIIKPYKNL